MISHTSVTNTTKGKLPRLPFVLFKNHVLGEQYSLSVVFVGDARSQALNKAYRNKDKPTNVLSFALSKSEGEIFVNLSQIKRETKLFGRSFQNLSAFLIIHALFHLKGLRHGSRMEQQEKTARLKFKI